MQRTRFRWKSNITKTILDVVRNYDPPKGLCSQQYLGLLVRSQPSRRSKAQSSPKMNSVCQYLLYITYLYILKILQSMSHGKTKTHLANCWNSECDGFGHGKQPMALETSACLYAAPDSSTYFLIISWTQVFSNYFLNANIRINEIRVFIIIYNINLLY